MAQFKPNSDTAVEASEPQLEVLVTAENPLKVGKHVFQLIVQDDTGNPSEPAHVTIIVQDTERPTAVIDAIRETGERVATPEVPVRLGERFVLTGERSSDIGGTVTLWQWRLLQA
jgi:hypothetical protein